MKPASSMFDASARCISAVRCPSSAARSRYAPMTSRTAGGRLGRGQLAQRGAAPRPAPRPRGGASARARRSAAAPRARAPRRSPRWGRRPAAPRACSARRGAGCIRSRRRSAGVRPGARAFRKRPSSSSGLTPSSQPAEHLQQVAVAVADRGRRVLGADVGGLALRRLQLDERRRVDGAADARRARARAERGQQRPRRRGRPPSRRRAARRLRAVAASRPPRAARHWRPSVTVASGST